MRELEGDHSIANLVGRRDSREKATLPVASPGKEIVWRQRKTTGCGGIHFIWDAKTSLKSCLWGWVTNPQKAPGRDSWRVGVLRADCQVSIAARGRVAEKAVDSQPLKELAKITS